MVYRVLTYKKFKMKKYYCVETDEQVNFGDNLNLTFFKETEDGKVTVEKNIAFTEDILDWMIEMGFVEEREVGEDEDKENTDLIDFGGEEPCETLADLIEDFEVLEEKVDKLENMHKDYISLINKMLDTFKEFVLNLPEEKEKKNAQPKKK